MTNPPPRDLAERTFLFSCAIVRFCRQLSTEPGIVRQIAWQLADAGTSVSANYEEAKGSYSRREFAAKTSIVLKEAREARLWLRIILACNLAADSDAAHQLYDESDQLVGIFIASLRKLRQPQLSPKTVVVAIAGISGFLWLAVG